jgi:hypothetical protein
MYHGRDTGTTTRRGCVHSATPYSSVAGFVMAAWAIEPTLFASAAATLIAGDDCAVDGFVKLNVTVYAVPDTVPPDAAVSTSVPELFVHTPAVPRRFDVDVTAKLPSAVCEPVSPVIVTVESAGMSTSALSVIVNVLVAPDTGVLCWIVLTLNNGTTTVSGSVPLATPYSGRSGFNIAPDAMEPTVTLLSLMVASILTLGDTWPSAGFFRRNTTT